MGKWSSLKGQLPALPGESPEWMDKVRAEKAGIIEGLLLTPINPGVTLANITDLYNRARADKDALAEREKTLNITIEALQQLLIAKLEESGSDIWRGNGHSFSEKVEPYASTENKLSVNEHFIPITAIESAIEAGDLVKAGDLLAYAKQQLGTMNVPWQTLNSLVKAEAEAGELVIEGEGENVEVRSTIPGVKVFLKSNINRRKSGE